MPKPASSWSRRQSRRTSPPSPSSSARRGAGSATPEVSTHGRRVFISYAHEDDTYNPVDPSTLTGRTFLNPVIMPGDHNLAAVKEAEIPASNGVATERSARQ